MKAQFLLTVGPYLQKAQFLLIVGSYFRGAFNKPTKEIDISSEGPTVMQKESCTPIVGPAATLEQALHQVMHTASSQGDVRSSCRSNHSSAVGLDMPV